MTRLINVLSLLALLMLAAQSHATDDASQIDVCRDYSLIAKRVMTARQKRQPMSETLPYTMKLIEEWAKKYAMEMDSNMIEEGATLLVIPAYETDIFPNDSLWNEDRQDTINEFENRAFEHCYESMTTD